MLFGCSGSYLPLPLRTPGAWQVKESMLYLLDATIASKGVFSCIVTYDSLVRGWECAMCSPAGVWDHFATRCVSGRLLVLPVLPPPHPHPQPFAMDFQASEPILVPRESGADTMRQVGGTGWRWHCCNRLQPRAIG